MQINYQVKNFKAFRDTEILELAPITVLCGANSSGKSSIIKSILLAKQSSAERRTGLKLDAPSPPLLFNGELVRLGSWTDTVTGKDRTRKITLHWQATMDADELQAALAKSGARRITPVEGQQNFDLSIEIRSDPNIREEISSVVDGWVLQSNNIVFEIFLNAATPHDRPTYKARISNVAQFIRRSGPRFNSNRIIWSDLLRALRASNSSIELGNTSVITSGPFITRIEPIFDSSWIPFFETIHRIALEYRGRKRGPQPGWLADLTSAIRQFRKTASERQPLRANESAMRTLLYLTYDFVTELMVAFGECKAALAPMWRDVRYLGPLRDQPRRYYQFDDTGGTDIGVSGEYTVQVLALEQGREVRSSKIVGSPGTELTISDASRETLLGFTNYWLDWMGLPTVEPSTLQQSLYSLKVGHLGVALPDVGFGVSQVLPIIVEALRADRGDLVILEQPEIHLHPRVQALLADFLIARSRDGVRFLVESHSEYLIKRICRRVSEGHQPNLRSDANIIFITTGPDGAKCEKVELNDFGEILNWPAGFFDLNEDLYWTQAALSRRIQSRSAEKGPAF